MNGARSLNNSIDKEYKFPCVGECATSTFHKVVLSVDLDGFEPNAQYFYRNIYQIVECQGCQSISFRQDYTTSVDEFYHEATNERLGIDRSELFPKRIKGRRTLTHIYFLPPDIARIYKETYSALCNDQPVLASIGLRALVETVCKDKKATGKDLKDRIDGLVKIGHLTEAGAEILHSLRIMGNLAAHEVIPHPEDDLNNALEVVEHLLKGVYILPIVASKLPKQKPAPVE